MWAVVVHGFFTELQASGCLAQGSNHMFHDITTEWIGYTELPRGKVTYYGFTCSVVLVYQTWHFPLF